MSTTQYVEFVKLLPQELIDQITSLLDFRDWIRLAATNRCFRAEIDPQECSIAKKEAFIKKAQQWPKHNKCFVLFKFGRRDAYWETNAFACYSCFRVLPQSKFSLRQMRKHLAKESPKEGTKGCKRFCLDCGVESRKYRRGTHMKATLALRHSIGLGDMLRKDEMRMYCSYCDAVVVSEGHMEGFHPSEMKYSVSLDMRFFRCKDCDEIHLDIDRVCSLCKKGICKTRGMPVTEENAWWCGRTCSKGAMKWVAMILDGVVPVQAIAADEVEGKRKERVERLRAEEEAVGLESMRRLFQKKAEGGLGDEVELGSFRRLLENQSSDETRDEEGQSICTLIEELVGNS